MDEIAKLLKQGEDHFKSGPINSKEFNAFAPKFKAALKKELVSTGAKDFKFNKGHFTITGFFTAGKQAWYFSLSDVRWWHTAEPLLLYRTAKSYQDYAGGVNRYVRLNTGMAKNMTV